MKREGMSASDLARQVWGPKIDKRGYSVARNRDRISHYLAGTSYPEPQNLQIICKVLNAPLEELAIVPRTTGHTYEYHDNPGPRFPRPTPKTLNMTTVPGQAGKIRLQLDMVLSWDLAGRVYQMLLEADAAAAAAAEQQPAPGDVIRGGRDEDDDDEDNDGNERAG